MLKNASSHRNRSAQAGFTLIELMIVIAVIGILAAISIPIANDHLNRGRVGAAMATGTCLKAALHNYQIGVQAGVGRGCLTGDESCISFDEVTSAVNLQQFATENGCGLNVVDPNDPDGSNFLPTEGWCYIGNPPMRIPCDFLGLRPMNFEILVQVPNVPTDFQGSLISVSTLTPVTALVADNYSPPGP